MKAEVGKTYRCNGGWLRRVLEFRNTRGLEEVRYECRKEGAKQVFKFQPWSPRDWFENEVIEEAKSTMARAQEQVVEVYAVGYAMGDLSVVARSKTARERLSRLFAEAGLGTMTWSPALDGEDEK